MNRTKGVSLAKGPVGIIGIVLLAGGILGLLFGSTSFTAEPPDGAVTGGTWFGIEGNGWTWVLFAGAGILLLLSAPMHWGAKTMALIVGLAMGAAAVLSLIDADGGEVLGIFASNDATTLVFAVAAAACLIVALLPRVGRRRVEDDVAYRDRTGRFDREAGVAEPVGRRRM
jgi:hypothetical protein